MENIDLKLKKKDLNIDLKIKNDHQHVHNVPSLVEVVQLNLGQKS